VTGHDDLARAVVERCLPPGSRTVAVGAPQVNYYSIVFSIDAEAAGAARGLFVKVPKMDLRGREKTFLPLTGDDRRLGQAEYDSLRAIERDWHSDDLGVRWVRPLGYLDEWNAIVTERAYAPDALDDLRRLDRRRRRSAADGTALDDLLGRFGAALRRYHDVGAAETTVPDAAAKFARLGAEVIAKGGPRVARRLADAAAGAWPRGRAIAAWTLKGIDIRNLLLDHERRIVVLDPGLRKFTVREADLARFLVTWRILYWGHWAFAAGMQPAPAAECAFLRGYAGDTALDPAILRGYMLKELFKHWATARESLHARRWPPGTTRAIGALYIDRFYAAQIRKELRAAGGA
jgi:hypothetical protein